MPGLVLQALRRDSADGDAGAARLGFTVTKKIGNAVVRNRTRRRLQEAARLWLAEHPVAGVDLVLIGREGTCRRDFRKLQDDLRRALEKTGVTQVGATQMGVTQACVSKAGMSKAGISKARMSKAGAT